MMLHGLSTFYLLVVSRKTNDAAWSFYFLLSTFYLLVVSRKINDAAWFFLLFTFYFLLISSK